MDQKTVLITGGTGLIGLHLAPMLKKRGWRIVLLSRSGKEVAGWDAVFKWDPETGYLEEGALDGVTHIVHLAGAGIAEKRWTDERKQEIIDSRVKSAHLLYGEVKRKGIKLQTFISASGIGWYGMITDDKIHHEGEVAADDFLGKTCKLWEEAADCFSDFGSRVVKIRTGIVLAKEGGALPVLSLPVRLFSGCILGSGKQQMPWIHIDDLCGIYIEALENNQWQGAFNAVATPSCTHREFMKTLASALKRPLWPLSLHSGILRLIIGEGAGMVTAGSAISNEKLLSMKFEMKFTKLDEALKNNLA